MYEKFFENESIQNEVKSLIKQHLELGDQLPKKNNDCKAILEEIIQKIISIDWSFISGDESLILLKILNESFINFKENDPNELGYYQLFKDYYEFIVVIHTQIKIKNKYTQHLLSEKPIYSQEELSLSLSRLQNLIKFFDKQQIKFPELKLYFIKITTKINAFFFSDITTLSPEDSNRALRYINCLRSIDYLFIQTKELHNLKSNYLQRIIISSYHLTENLAFFMAHNRVLLMHLPIKPWQLPEGSIDAANAICLKVMNKIKTQIDLSLEFNKIKATLLKIGQIYSKSPADFLRLPAVFFKHAKTFEKQYEHEALKNDPQAFKGQLVLFDRHMKRLCFELEVHLIYNDLCCSNFNHEANFNLILNNFSEMGVSTADIELLGDSFQKMSIEKDSILLSQLLKLKNDLLSNQSPELPIIKRCIFHLFQLIQGSPELLQIKPSNALSGVLKTIEKVGTNLNIRLKGQSPRMIYAPHSSSTEQVSDKLPIITNELSIILNQLRNFLTEFKSFRDYKTFSEDIDDIEKKFIDIMEIYTSFSQCFSNFVEYFENDINLWREHLKKYPTVTFEEERFQDINDLISHYRENIIINFCLMKIAVFFNKAFFEKENSKVFNGQGSLACAELQKIGFRSLGIDHKLDSLRILLNNCTEKTLIIDNCLVPITDLFLKLKRDEIYKNDLIINFFLSMLGQLENYLLKDGWKPTTLTITFPKVSQSKGLTMETDSINLPGILKNLVHSTVKRSLEDAFFSSEKKPRFFQGKDIGSGLNDLFRAWANTSNQNEDEMMEALADSMTLSINSLKDKSIFGAIADQLSPLGFSFESDQLRSEFIKFLQQNKDDYLEFLSSDFEQYKSGKSRMDAEYIVLNGLIRMISMNYATNINVMIYSTKGVFPFVDSNPAATLNIGYDEEGSYYSFVTKGMALNLNH